MTKTGNSDAFGPIFQYSSIPVFQYSSIPVFQYSGFDEI